MPRLPKKNKGDGLGAGHVNELSRAAEYVLSDRPGSYMHGSPNRGLAGIEPFMQCLVEIIEAGCDQENDHYLVRPRFWNNVDDQWEVDDNLDGYCLDPTDVGLTFAVGDKVTAYFNPQRNTFIPIASTNTAVQPPTTPGSGDGCQGCTCMPINSDTFKLNCEHARENAKVSKFWEISGGYPALTCCLDVSQNIFLAAYGTDGCTFFSSYFSCTPGPSTLPYLQTARRWVMIIAEDWVELSLDLTGYAPGDKALSLRYRIRTDDFHPVCENRLFLWSPEHPKFELCGAPCEICIYPPNPYHAAGCGYGNVHRDWEGRGERICHIKVSGQFNCTDAGDPGAEAMPKTFQGTFNITGTGTTKQWDGEVFDFTFDQATGVYIAEKTIIGNTPEKIKIVLWVWTHASQSNSIAGYIETMFCGGASSEVGCFDTSTITTRNPLVAQVISTNGLGGIAGCLDAIGPGAGVELDLTE